MLFRSSTDVYSYHIDRSPIETDTFLCTYYGAASDILPNSQAQQKISISEIRNKLKALYDGPEAEFGNFLEENFFVSSETFLIILLVNSTVALGSSFKDLITI